MASKLIAMASKQAHECSRITVCTKNGAWEDFKLLPPCYPVLAKSNQHASGQQAAVLPIDLQAIHFHFGPFRLPIMGFGHAGRHAGRHAGHRAGHGRPAPKDLGKVQFAGFGRLLFVDSTRPAINTIPPSKGAGKSPQAA